MKRFAFAAAGLAALGLVACNPGADAKGGADTADSGPVADKYTLKVLGTHRDGVFDESAAEIVDYDEASKCAVVVNSHANEVDVIDLSDPSAPVKKGTLSAEGYGNAINSVSVHNGIVAAAVQAEDKQAPGKALFFTLDGTVKASVGVGALPDLITFTPDGKFVLVANEGEPSDDYTNDPEGSVSVISIPADITTLDDSMVKTAGFGDFAKGDLDASTRVFGPNATPAMDFEPEYIAVSSDSKTAYVALQENNAMAIVDIAAAKVTAVKGFGFKDHWADGNGFDASNKSEGIDIRVWPVWGMYQPDTIEAFEVGGATYIISANEGDAREYDGYEEETRVAKLQLDPESFSAIDVLQDPTMLGRLKTTTANGDLDGDGLHEEIYAYGARSFSIWDANGVLVWDSGDQLERITSERLPDDFNSNNDENGSAKSRSDDKGPEPECVEVGEVGGKLLGFVGLERVGGILVYDLSDPTAPVFMDYVNNRDFSVDATTAEAGDLGPESIKFIHASKSPNGKPLIIVGNEVSGTTTVFEIVAAE